MQKLTEEKKQLSGGLTVEEFRAKLGEVPEEKGKKK